jgi:hypothetical protein
VCWALRTPWTTDAPTDAVLTGSEAECDLTTGAAATAGGCSRTPWPTPTARGARADPRGADVHDRGEQVGARTRCAAAWSAATWSVTTWSAATWCATTWSAAAWCAAAWCATAWSAATRCAAAWSAEQVRGRLVRGHLVPAPGSP